MCPYREREICKWAEIEGGRPQDCKVPQGQQGSHTQGMFSVGHVLVVVRIAFVRRTADQSSSTGHVFVVLTTVSLHRWRPCWPSMSGLQLTGSTLGRPILLMTLVLMTQETCPDDSPILKSKR